MSSSSTARPTISSSTGRSAGRPSRPPTFLRRSGAADRGARHSRQGRAVGPDHRLFGAVFNGNAARPGDGDPQLRDNHGLAFRVNDPPWVIGQVRWDYDIDFGEPSAGRQFHAGRLVSYRTVRRSALHRAGRRRSPTLVEPASRQSFAAISESSRSWSRRSTGRRR